MTAKERQMLERKIQYWVNVHNATKNRDVKLEFFYKVKAGFDIMDGLGMCHSYKVHDGYIEIL